MKTFIKLSLLTLACSVASIKAMNDQDLARALELSQQSYAQEQARETEVRARAERERAQYLLEQEQRAAEEKKKKEAGRNQPELNDALIVAAGEGSVEKVQKLLEQRADVNAMSANNGSTPLIKALYHSVMGFIEWQVINPKYHEVVRCLVHNGADVNKKNKAGQAPLWFLHGVFPATFKLILDKNPDLTVGLDEENTTIAGSLKKLIELHSGGSPVVKELKFELKLKMLEEHVGRIAAQNRANVEAQARPVLVAVTNNPLADLMMDYYGNGDYPLSDEIELPFTPKIKSNTGNGFINPGKQ